MWFGRGDSMVSDVQLGCLILDIGPLSDAVFVWGEVEAGFFIDRNRYFAEKFLYVRA